MNKQPIQEYMYSDLRLSEVALLRTARRAQYLAKTTGTTIVVGNNGVIEHLLPTPEESSTQK